MENVAIARINTFGPSPKADFESPSDQLIVLTYAQLQDHIKGAIEQAIQPLQDEIAQFREEIDQDRQEIAALRESVASLVSTQEQDTTRICLDIAYDRQRLAKLERIELQPLQPLQRDRGEILRSLIVANGGKMLAKDARKKMRVPKSSFSELLKACDFVEKRPYHLDSRQDVLVLK